MTPEQSAAVARLREAIARHAASNGDYERAAWHQAAMMLCVPPTIRTLLAALDEAQADAARYRKWRADYTGVGTTEMLIALADAGTPWQVDAAIDAARAGEKS